MFYACIIGESFFPYPVTDGNHKKEILMEKYWFDPMSLGA